MTDIPLFHVLEESATVAVHPDLVQQLEQDGFPVQVTLRGLFTTGVEADGPINEEYCWMHSPGGWTCVECRV